MVKIYVGGLPYSTTQDELQELASRIAPEATASIVMDRITGRSRGFGFIEVADLSGAERIIQAYNAMEFGGRRLTVNEAKPLESRFPKIASLLDPMADFPVQTRIVQISEQVSADLVAFFAKHPEEMKLMPHRRFEELIAEVWFRFGYEVELTKHTRDGGIDVVAVKNSEIKTRFLIQCKRLAPGNKVSVEPVRELLGVKQDMGGSKAILATTVHFTPDAKMFLDRHMWDLEGKDYEGVVAWLQLAMAGGPL